ncbi:hypothetical protein BGZ47_006649 [Haplosporangium gracile]|nr:hypothetical protein BGZ47_006649 [Haplosporangium gracile]
MSVRMMQSAFKPEGQIQTSVDPGPMDYESIMTRGYPFVSVRRVNVNDPAVNLEYEVQSRCVDDGEPVVLEGFHLQEKWNADIFTFPYLQAKFGDEKILCRDLHNAEDVDLTMAQYIEAVHSDTLGSDFASSSIHPNPSISGNQETLWPRKPLIYAKDLTCPSTWRNFLMNGGLPPFLAYMRENDLNNLNAELAAENLMVYIGQAGTWTPAHIDQCGAIGHNIMTWADKGRYRKAGADSSSIWFMIRSKDRKKAEKLWSSFGQPLDYEGYFADLDELQSATFPIYVVQQKIGDFVMVPSQCVHQVVNLGKATIKVSWNRLTPNCLKAAMNSVLPRYRQYDSSKPMIGRPEGYRIKVIITSTLKAWTEKLETQEDDFGLPKDDFSMAFKEVLELYRGIVEEEWVDLHAMGLVSEPFERPKRLKESHHSQPAICDFCQADIWNRQFQCRECVDGEDAYDLCAQCYSLGRGCEHREDRMDFVENFSMESCRLAYCRALAAWNQSTALSGCPSHEPIADTWFEKLKSRTQMSADCSSCPLSFCELCLYKYYDALWTDIVGRQSGWKCFRCQGVCPCAQNDKRAAAGCAPPEASHAKSLWFTRPEDDYRNHGGVSDDLGPSEQENVALGEDGRIERPQIAHGSHISKRTKPRPARADGMLDTSTFQRRRSFTPDSQSASTKKDKRSRSAMDDDDDGEWRAKPNIGRGTLTKKSRFNQAHADDLSDTNSHSNYRRSLITRAQSTNFRKSRTKSLRPATTEAVFTSYLGEEQELVRTTAVKAGLTRTLASLHKLQLAAGMTAYDVFELDKRCASLDPVLRASFRADLMEKRQQARVVTNKDAVGANRPQKQLNEKGEMKPDDVMGKAGHHLNSDEGAQGEISSKKRIQKRLKEKGETMREDVAGKSGRRLQSNEEAREDTPNEKRPQKRLKEKVEMREDATGKVRDHLQSDEEARDGISNGKQPLKRFKNKGKAQEDAAGEDRLQSHRDEEQEENTRAADVDGKPLQKRPKEKEEGAREVVAVDDRDRQTTPAPVKRMGAVSSQHPSRTRKLNKTKESFRRSPSLGASQNKDRDDEESTSPPTHSSRSKRCQGAAAATLAKSEARPKSPESEKKAAILRRPAAGSKKQSGFLNSASDIPNHSFTKTEHLEDTETKVETEIGTTRNEKATNILGSSRIINPRNVDDEEHGEVKVGALLATQLFEPQTEDSSITNVPTNQPSPTSPASPRTPTDAIHPPPLNTKEDKASQEANMSTEAVTVSRKTANYTLSTFQKTIEAFKETSSATKETSSTTRETTLIIQESTPAPQIPAMRVEREIKPKADEELTKTIITATGVIHCTRSITAVNGTSNGKADTVVPSAIQGAENANTTTKITATNPTTITNTTTTTTSTSTGNASDTTVTTNVRKGPIKIVRSSPSQTIVKEIVDNSIKGASKLTATTTAAAAQEQHLSNGKHEHLPKSLLSLSSSLTSVSLISISSTDTSVNRPDNTTTLPVTRSHRSKVEESGVSRNIHMAKTEEPPIGRRTRTNSRT